MTLIFLRLFDYATDIITNGEVYLGKGIIYSGFEHLMNNFLNQFVVPSSIFIPVWLRIGTLITYLACMIYS